MKRCRIVLCHKKPSTGAKRAAPPPPPPPPLMAIQEGVDAEPKPVAAMGVNRGGR